MIKSRKNMEMLENTSKHVKLMIIYICTNKRCFNIVRTVRVMKMTRKSHVRQKRLRIDYGK